MSDSGASAPSESIVAYTAALSPGRLERFAVTDIDRVGVPTWSVTLHAADGTTAGGHGYGVTDEEALRGALGELSEVVHSAAALARLPRRTGSAVDLGDDAVDPRALGLPAGSPVDHRTERVWVPARRLADDAERWVPIEAAASLPTELPDGYRPSSTVITNGLGAGPTLAFAVDHGLLELVQRDGNGLSFRALDQGVVLDLGGADLGPDTAALLDRLDAVGIEVLAKLASTEHGVANVYVVGADRDRDTGDALMATACGEAADPDRRRALRKAVLEFAAARARKAFTHGPLDRVAAIAPPGYLDDYLREVSTEDEEVRALDAMVDWLGRSNAEMVDLLGASVLAQRRRVAFDTLPDGTGPPVAERLAADGFEVLVVDLSPPGADKVAVAKVIVPGLEVETMSYHRIGERNVRRLLERESPLVGLGSPPPGARPVRLTPDAEERLGGPAWLDVGAVDELVGPLYPLYREPGRHVAPLTAERRSTGR